MDLQKKVGSHLPYLDYTYKISSLDLNLLMMLVVRQASHDNHGMMTLLKYKHLIQIY